MALIPTHPQPKLWAINIVSLQPNNNEMMNAKHYNGDQSVESNKFIDW
jgi:hypothetical protein